MRKLTPRPTEWFYFEQTQVGLTLRIDFPPRPVDSQAGEGATPWYKKEDHWDEDHVHVRGWNEADARKRAARLLIPWEVYVIQSQAPRYNKRGQRLPGVHYVGCTRNVHRRLQQHDGLSKGGGKYTSKHRPWKLMAIFGPYYGQSEALKAERALKHGKRGTARTLWTPADSKWCRGLGINDPRIAEINRQVQVELEKG